MPLPFAEGNSLWYSLSKIGLVPGTDAAMTARPVSMPEVMDMPKVSHDGSVLVHKGCRYAIRTAPAIHALQNSQIYRSTFRSDESTYKTPTENNETRTILICMDIFNPDRILASIGRGQIERSLYQSL